MTHDTRPGASPGYIYARDWEKFQHYKDRRPPWIKTYTDLIHNDAYLRLSPFERGVLHGVWLLIAEQGQGRVWAETGHLRGLLNVSARRGQRLLEPLIEAGFIEVRASKAQAERKQLATPETETEELSNDSSKEGGASTAEAAHRLGDKRLGKRRLARVKHCRELYQALIAAGEDPAVARYDLEYTFKDDPAILSLALPKEPAA